MCACVHVCVHVCVRMCVCVCIVYIIGYGMAIIYYLRVVDVFRRDVALADIIILQLNFYCNAIWHLPPFLFLHRVTLNKERQLQFPMFAIYTFCGNHLPLII